MEWGGRGCRGEGEIGVVVFVRAEDGIRDAAWSRGRGDVYKGRERVRLRGERVLGVELVLRGGERVLSGERVLPRGEHVSSGERVLPRGERVLRCYY